MAEGRGDFPGKAGTILLARERAESGQPEAWGWGWVGIGGGLHGPLHCHPLPGWRQEVSTPPQTSPGGLYPSFCHPILGLFFLEPWVLVGQTGLICWMREGSRKHGEV